MPALLVVLLLAVSAGAQYEEDHWNETGTIDSWETPGDSLVPPDTSGIPDTSPSNKKKIVKRDFDYKEQLRLSLSMMAFIALVMTTVQNWNPN